MDDLVVQSHHEPEHCTALTSFMVQGAADEHPNMVAFACQRQRHARGKHRWENPDTGHVLEWPDAPPKA